MFVCSRVGFVIAGSKNLVMSVYYNKFLSETKGVWLPAPWRDAKRSVGRQSAACGILARVHCFSGCSLSLPALAVRFVGFVCWRPRPAVAH